MVRFSDSMFVKRLEIHGAAMFTRFLPLYHHTSAPGHRRTHWDRFDDPETYVLIKSCLDLDLGVYRDWDGAVKGDWFCIRVDHETHEWATHHR